MKKISSAIVVVLILGSVYLRTFVLPRRVQAQTAPSPSPAFTYTQNTSRLKPLDRSRLRKLGDLKTLAAEGQDAAPAEPTPSGKMRIIYKLFGSEEYQAYRKYVLKARVFEDLADTVNQLVPLKKDLVLRFDEIGEPNAFYSPKDDSITVGCEFIALFEKLCKGPEDKQADFIRGATFFFVLHELGHALVQRMDLPITGREEDAVDQFATVLLLQQGDEGRAAILDGAQFFLAIADLTAKNGQKPAFWDEHSLEIQRFYNIATWIYGADPFGNVHLVARGLLPEQRAARARDEYEKMHKAWKTLLDPKLKRPLK